MLQSSVGPTSDLNLDVLEQYPQLFLPFLTLTERRTFAQFGLNEVSRAEKCRLARWSHPPRTVDGRSVNPRQISFDLDQPLIEISDEELKQNFGDTYGGPDEVHVSGAWEQEWSDEAVFQLAENLLYYSIKLLGAKGNAEEKADIFEWIYGPDIVGWRKVQDGDAVIRRPVMAHSTPFTYQFCCVCARVDPSLLIEDLETRLRRHSQLQVSRSNPITSTLHFQNTSN
jgi:hypothetical protein